MFQMNRAWELAGFLQSNNGKVGVSAKKKSVRIDEHGINEKKTTMTKGVD